MSILSQLDHLIALALIDHDFSTKEKNMIISLAKANKIPEKDVTALMDKHLTKGKIDLSLPSLTSDEKFEYIYNIVQLMKIDREVFLSEIRFCENLAEKLGYNKKVISHFSQQIFSDPSITSDREKLKKEMEKFAEN